MGSIEGSETSSLLLFGSPCTCLSCWVHTISAAFLTAETPLVGDCVFRERKHGFAQPELASPNLADWHLHLDPSHGQSMFAAQRRSQKGGHALSIIWLIGVLCHLPWCVTVVVLHVCAVRTTILELHCCCCGYLFGGQERFHTTRGTEEGGPNVHHACGLFFGCFAILTRSQSFGVPIRCRHTLLGLHRSSLMADRRGRGARCVRNGRGG